MLPEQYGGARALVSLVSSRTRCFRSSTVSLETAVDQYSEEVEKFFFEELLASALFTSLEALSRTAPYGACNFFAGTCPDLCAESCLSVGLCPLACVSCEGQDHRVSVRVAKRKKTSNH